MKGFAFFIFREMRESIQRLILLISSLTLISVLVFNFFFVQKNEEDAYFEAVQEEVYAIEEEFDQDLAALTRLLSTSRELTFEALAASDARHPIFILDSAKTLVGWTDFSVSLDYEKVDLSQESQLILDSYGTFVVRVHLKEIASHPYYFLQAFRLFWPGSIQNNYLLTGANRRVFGNDQIDLKIPEEKADYLIQSRSGVPLFGVDFTYGYEPSKPISNVAVLIFFSSVFLLFLIVGSELVLRLWKKGKRWKSLAALFIILISFRIGMLLLEFPRSFFTIDLFEPSNYASSWLNPSLGDLLINSIIFLGVMGVAFYLINGQAFQNQLQKIQKPVMQDLLILLFFGLSSMGFFSIWYLPKDLIQNSQWAMDTSAIPTFGWYEGISFSIVFLWASVYGMLTLTLIRAVLHLRPEHRLVLRFFFLVGVLIGAILLIYSFWLGISWFVHLGFLFLVFRFELHRQISLLSLSSFLTFFFVSLICASIVGISTFDSEKIQLNQSKIRFANQNLLEGDVMTEFFLGEVFDRLQADLFVQNRLVDPLLSKEPIEAKIRKFYLGSYFDQFEVLIRIFSPYGRDLLSNQDSRSLDVLRDQFIKSGYLTNQQGLYFIRGQEANEGNRFAAFIPIKKDSLGIGTLFLELKQLRTQPSSVYPRLLLDRNFSEKLNAVRFEYAIFSNQTSLRSSGSFNYSDSDFQRLLKDPNLQKEGIHQGGYHHLAVKNGEELLVISSPARPISYFIGNISLYFVVFILLTFFTVLMTIPFRGATPREFAYSTKLQLYLNFAFFFPIVIISVITIRLLTNSYQENLNRQYVQKAVLLKSNLTNFISNQGAEGLSQESLNLAIHELATTVLADLHLYGAEGVLMGTNRPTIFDKRILSSRINPLALATIQEKKQSSLLAEEQVGRLLYKSVYLAIPDASSPGIFGILSVPFFESEAELNELIEEVLSNIFNALMVIFILFLVISYLVSRNLTFPFRLLTQKLKSTNLEDNEPMSWEAKDEIGLLVDEYNHMLFKLEASRRVLANTEKESAWREMAKQVAHEIKNPLTPMKLTLQHLLRQEKEGKLTQSSKLRESFETLIHQVDDLSDIASSFSTFAKMPLPKNERMNLKTVLLMALDLFQNDKRLRLTFQDDTYLEEISIQGDDKLFGRIISNLIINGIQAVDKGKQPEILVWLWNTEKDVFLEISDNGKGIPEDLSDKIFIPNFSTKSTGSGLGLAIAKSGVELAGGKIWFETKIGHGTTFFLTFPLID